MFLIASSSQAELTHFLSAQSTPVYVQYFGELSINSHHPVNHVDEVAVFVNDGAGGELLVGATTVGTTEDNYYFINIYGDEGNTPQKDGAFANDTLIFKVWSSQDNKEQTIEQSQMTIQADPTLSQPDIPPVFHPVHGEQFGYLHLAFLTGSSEQSKISIPVTTNPGRLCFMFVLIGISIYYIRKSVFVRG